MASGSGFDMGAFVTALGRMGDVRPGEARPLVQSAADLERIPGGSIHSPSAISVAGNLPTVTFEIYHQVIPTAGSTDMQRHHHETVHFVIEGSGRSEIEDEEVRWGRGDLIYTPPWTWHRHYNTGGGDVEFLTIENSRLLGLLGVNRRQSAGMVGIEEARKWEVTHGE